MNFIVRDIINSNLAIYHEEGLILYHLLLKDLEEGKDKAEISFEGIERCSTQFLNACVGKLYLLNEPKKIDGFLSFHYLSPILKLKLDEVRENAIHNEQYDSLLTKAVS